LLQHELFTFSVDFDFTSLVLFFISSFLRNAILNSFSCGERMTTQAVFFSFSLFTELVNLGMREIFSRLAMNYSVEMPLDGPGLQFAHCNIRVAVEAEISFCMSVCIGGSRCSCHAANCHYRNIRRLKGQTSLALNILRAAFPVYILR
jgi:hypothetical protein